MNVRTLTLIVAALLVVSAQGCGQGAPDDPEAVADFCEQHQIAEAQCPFCNPSLVAALGQCVGHGVPEALCYQCNPALIPAFKAIADWCAGHDRPESQCYLCNPDLDPILERASAAATSGVADSVGASRVVSSGQSRTKRAPSVSCSTQSLLVRFEHPGIAEEAGLQFAAVESRPLSKTVECNAEIAYDGNRCAQIAPQVPGIIAKVHKDLGEVVERGEALVSITSAHLGAAKASYLQAVAAVALWERNHARETELLERGVSTERDLLEAETRLAESRISLSEAEQTLLSFGLSERQIERVREREDTSARYVVSAPFAGVVVDRHATAGEVVDPSKPLFAVADISRMWALIEVYESDLRSIEVGQPVVLYAEGLPGESFPGRLTWVSSQLNPQTRTLQVRAELDNSSGLLRANMFADAAITVRDHVPSLVVPASSVQWEGCCNVVFVKQSDTVYRPRKVHLGIATGTVYEVLSGLSPGEEVVTQGSFLLKTEILKESIGAGCCEVAPGV